MKTKFQRMFLIACATAACVPYAQAQSTEVFGGFLGGAMKPQDHDQFAIRGWNASTTRYINSRIGFTADFAGLYGDATTPDGASAENTPTRQYSFMGGPQIRIIRTARFETSFKALAGGVHGYIPDSSIPAGAAYNSFSQNSFASEFGSNLDFKINSKVSLRVSPGIYLTQFGQDQTQKNFRISVGPVFHFGSREN